MKLFSNKLTPTAFIRLTAPAVASMVFMALYCIVDGVFVARLIGENALAAVNIVLPLINLSMGFAIMLATGGSAIVGMALGEGRTEEASRDFTSLLISGATGGTIMAVVLMAFLQPVITLLGATPVLFEYCRIYGAILILTIPVTVVKTILEYFIRTDGNVKFSLWLSLSGGVVNIALDYIFMAKMDMGIAGAAWGTAIGNVIPAIIGALYFLRKSAGLHYARPQIKAKLLLKSCSNGFSEMVTELSTGITTLLFNLVTLQFLGESGLSAITIILYAHFLLNSVYLGFVCGVAPAVSYNYGANDRPQLIKLFHYSMNFLFISSALVFLFSVFGAPLLIGIFTSPGSPVFTIAIRGMYLFSGCFLFIGFNVFASGLFTAYGNGIISAVISFVRAFAFPIAGIIILPALFGSDGIWLSIPVSEILTLGFSLYFLWRFRFVYHYSGKEPKIQPCNAP